MKSEHGDCRVFNASGVLIRTDKIVSREIISNPLNIKRFIGLYECVSCSNQFLKYHGNMNRCANCAAVKAVQKYEQWKANKRAEYTARKRSH